MSLEKEVFIGNYRKESEKQIKIDVPGVKSERVVSIMEEAGYWRKAYAIHKWFVDNVQEGIDNSATYWVGDDQLKELLKLVVEVLEDHSKASELLPTLDGFCFGGLKYDEFYFGDLEDTKMILTEALSDGSESFYYHSSW